MGHQSGDAVVEQSQKSRTRSTGAPPRDTMPNSTPVKKDGESGADAFSEAIASEADAVMQRLANTSKSGEPCQMHRGEYLPRRKYERECCDIDCSELHLNDIRIGPLLRSRCYIATIASSCGVYRAGQQES
jgi:hypothetical protein